MAGRKLTKTIVDALQPRATDYVEWCGTLKGFGCRVRPSGSKSFIAQYRVGGRNSPVRKVTIGTFGKLTVEDARTEAGKVLAKAELGEDVAGTRAKERRAMTVSQLCDEYHADCKKGLVQNSKGEAKKDSTVSTDRGRIDRHIKPLIGNMKISDVRDHHIERFKKDIAAGKTKVKREGGEGFIVTGGKGAATRTIRLLGGIFTYAVKHGYLETNPRKGVKLFPDRKGERFLSPDEFARLAETLHEAETVGLPWQFNDDKAAKHRPKKGDDAREVISPYAIAAIRLLMLTGCRLSEILKLKWAHVDETKQVLNLPDSKTGAKKVLLGAAALKVLADLPRSNHAPEYVIAGDKPNKPRSDLKRPWARITEHAGLNVDGEGNPKPLRLHDLRHSFASTGIAAGMTLPMIGKLLGHASPQTTARYAHLAEEASRHAVNTIDGAIAAFAGKSAEILPFKQGAA